MSIGRNEPCSCGSGKKYKKCCGALPRPDTSTAEDQRIRAALNIAMRDYETGNLARAEILCRDVLDVRPNNADALTLLGLIAQDVNMPDFTRIYFNQAMALPTSSRLAEFAALREKLAKNPPPDTYVTTVKRDRFILIKAWGYGFWSDVDHVLGGLLLAEMTGRTPVVHWGANSLFSDDPAANAFETFFDPVSALTIDDLASNEMDYFPPKWSASNLRSEDNAKWNGAYSRMAALYLLGRLETVIVGDFHVSIMSLQPWIKHDHFLYGLSSDGLYRYLLDKYLKPRMAILDEVDNFYNRNLADVPYIAMHVRGSDKHLELPHLEKINQEYFRMIGKLPVESARKIFLLTDSADILSRYRQEFGDKLVSTRCLRTADDTGIHYKANSGGKSRLGIEVMVDTYLAARAERFIGNGASNVSCMVKYLRHWKENEYTLLVPSMHHARNPFLYG